LDIVADSSLSFAPDRAYIQGVERRWRWNLERTAGRPGGSTRRLHLSSLSLKVSFRWDRFRRKAESLGC